MPVSPARLTARSASSCVWASILRNRITRAHSDLRIEGFGVFEVMVRRRKMAHYRREPDSNKRGRGQLFVIASSARLSTKLINLFAIFAPGQRIHR